MSVYNPKTQEIQNIPTISNTEYKKKITIADLLQQNLAEWKKKREAAKHQAIIDACPNDRHPIEIGKGGEILYFKNKDHEEPVCRSKDLMKTPNTKLLLLLKLKEICLSVYQTVAAPVGRLKNIVKQNFSRL
jgi:hypothetical protein